MLWFDEISRLELAGKTYEVLTTSIDGTTPDVEGTAKLDTLTIEEMKVIVRSCTTEVKTTVAVLALRPNEDAFTAETE